jgi:APA family basic amino acid/polyamine antiporter
VLTAKGLFSGDNYLLSQSPPDPTATVRTSESQLLCCKSIDKLIAESEAPGQRLQKTLGPWSLTALGIGAIIGSGIFILTGTAAAGEYFQAPSILHAQALDVIINLLRTGSTAGALMHGRPPAGPSIAISFLLVAIACSFAGLCYAELASMIPIAGSAYTYSYATLGEIFAWIIGWDLILEYVVSNVAVAVGFAGYTKAQLAVFGINLPEKLASPVWAGGQWTGAYFNLPGFLIVFFLTLLLVRGVKESAKTNNVMVAVKIGAILTFLVVGGMLVKPANWVPFAPSGFAGIVTGGAIVFFTYIGFDSVSTAAEESRNPQKDLPFGIIMSLVVCTLLYVGVAVVLLGMMKYTTFVSGEAAEAPVAYAMKYLGVHPIFRSVIVIGALTGMISSLLVFQYGQARIWYAMSRDGLLPKLFSAVHPRFKTPHISTWIACFAVGIPAGLVDIGDAADLANIGTLFAFVLVSLGVIILRRRQPDRKRAFRVPFVPWFPLISVLFCGGLMFGLTITTWIRFVLWLTVGMVLFLSWGRYWSEFASEDFKGLLSTEKRLEADMPPQQRAVYKAQRKSPGLAWLLCYFLGAFGAHHYYMKRWIRGVLYAVIGIAYLILLWPHLVSLWQAGWWPLALLLVFCNPSSLAAFVDLFWVVKRSQEYNLQTAHRILAS